MVAARSSKTGGACTTATLTDMRVSAGCKQDNISTAATSRAQPLSRRRFWRKLFRVNQAQAPFAALRQAADAGAATWPSPRRRSSCATLRGVTEELKVYEIPETQPESTSDQCGVLHHRPTM